MEKVRVYQLAKELNTTSKRLIEKLEEININIKNHMSFLDEEQVKALYEHIGVITHKGHPGTGEGAKKQMPTPPKPEPRREPPSREMLKGPRIIRKTEVILDSNGEDYYGRGDRLQKKSPRKKRRDYVKVADDTSGLRAGFVRDTGINLVALKKALEKEKREAEELKKKEAEELKIKSDELKRKEEEELKRKEAEELRKKEEELKKKEAEELKRKEAEELKKKEEELKKAEAEKKRKEAEELEREKSREIREKKTTPAPEITVEKPLQAVPQAVEEKDVKEPVKKKVIKEVIETRSKKPESEIAAPERSQEPAPDRVEKERRGRAPSDKTEKIRRSDKRPDRGKTAGITIPDLPEGIRTEKDSHKTERRLSQKPKQLDDRELKKEPGKLSVLPKKKRFNAQSILAGKKDVADLLAEEFELDELIEDFKKKKKAAGTKKDARAKSPEKPKPSQKPIKVPEQVTVKDFAERIKKSATEVIKKLMAMGMMVTINEEIDYDTALIIADEFGVTIEKEIVVSEEDILFDDSEDENEEELVPRAPVVVVMGHVDHGKTSLLDAIRKANVTEAEAGGITQHIGAYTVTINGRDITFIDTPGHEAFTSLRARGAQVTDIAILVVAADDGVMPQTVEAINHAKAAKVSIIVAINKIDLPGANPDRVKQQLTEHGLLPEEWGGDVICVPVSAKNGQNIDELLEMVLLTADILELKANPNRQAKGTVIEAELDRTRGVIATLLVQRGTLNLGDSIVTGTTFGRIRAMVDDKGREIEKAGPSMPVEILGLPEVPIAGEVFYAVKDEKVARQLVEKRKDLQRTEQMKATAKVSLEELFSQIQEGNVKELNIILKADTQGSVEAIRHSLEKISNDEVKVKIIHGGVGAVTETDVNLAEVANALIIGFNVRPGANVMELAESEGVDIRFYRVIYEAIEDIEAAIKGMLEPKYKETVIGHAEIRQIFKVSGVGTIAGCYVTNGKITRNSNIRVVRDGVVIHEGGLASLKRFKDDVREVAQGYECGLAIEKFNDIKEGDVLEAYIMERVDQNAPKASSTKGGS